ncbi:hypothetical protein TEU_01435 [Thermococcus eurythermalis]|uniref:Uncharacterized protein n=1 Tax=Thermococcus eurythermalis TaxID=1505907 RepID=A0A097QRK4_9EURY|nr:hypothetical protein [Thermococcus eurythermalis]AIU69105.1 hypothetical protein TEU_01435 [Thermococcus eurythermalis]
MNTTLFVLAVAFIILATYANMKGAHKPGLALSGVAGGLATMVLFEGKLNPSIAFAVGFVATVAFEKARFSWTRR